MARRILTPEQQETKRKRNVASAKASRERKLAQDPDYRKKERAKRQQSSRARAVDKAYREANRERLKAASAAYLEKNREKNRESCKVRYQEKKAEYAVRSAKYFERNKPAVKAMQRDWRQANPEQVRALRWKRKARIKANGGVHTGDDIKRLHALQRGKCAFCFKSFRNGYHVEHRIPISKGGSNDPSNLQLSCGPCNQKKHAKDPLDFARQLGRLV